jgi:diaminobutyrate-2-oxoglutarate transaminase
MDGSPPIEELHFADAPAVDTIPGPESRRLRERQEHLEGGAVLYPETVPLAFTEAKGATLRDADGNTYLDFFAGIGVLNVGHSNPYVLEAVREQTETLAHNLDFPHEARLDLVEKLDDIAPDEMAGNSAVTFGGPTGSDAVEASIKLAKYNTDNHGLIAFRGSFHGETAGAFSLSADTEYKSPYTPLLPEVQHVQYPYPFAQDRTPEEAVAESLADLERVLGDRYGGLANPAGVWVEPIQGEGGIVVPPEGFLQGVRELCDEHGVPMIADEVQTGFGRTGRWWGSDHFDVTPDIVPMAKAFGAGLPLAGILYREEYDTWGPGGHTGTFRGYLPAMRAALRSIEYVEEHDLLAHAREVGGYLRDRFEAVAESNPLLGEVRGRGMYVGLEFVDESGDPSQEIFDAVRDECYANGAAVWGGGRGGNVLRLIPPLVLTREQAEIGADIVADAVETVTRSRR